MKRILLAISMAAMLAALAACALAGTGHFPTDPTDIQFHEDSSPGGSAEGANV